LTGGLWANDWSLGKTVEGGVGVGVDELPPPQPTTLVIDIPAQTKMAANTTKTPKHLFMVSTSVGRPARFVSAR